MEEDEEERTLFDFFFFFIMIITFIESLYGHNRGGSAAAQIVECKLYNIKLNGNDYK